MTMEFGRRMRDRVGDRWRAADATEASAVPELYHDRDLAAGAEEVLIERSDFFIRLATTHGHRRQGSLLIHRMYSWRGYAWDMKDDLPHGPNQVTLQACGPEGVFGTLSLRVDSRGGLLADELYGREIDAYRVRGASVCEMTWFAVDRDYGAREVIACLFQLIYVYARRVHRRTDLFIEVNPRHVGFYQQRLGFRIAGAQRICARVGAPAVLLHLDLDYVDAQRNAGRDDRDGERPSLYPFFLSRHEEEGLCRRIGVVPAQRSGADERPTRFGSQRETEAAPRRRPGKAQGSLL
jgi:hypothetical protein